MKRTGKVMSVPIGDELVGRIVNPLGIPLDGQGPLQASESRLLEFKAPGVVHRQPVFEPLQTGIKAIDSMIPVGRGQRESVIGDRSTGKTAILVDTILNQRGQDMICIYVAIGQKASTVAQVYERRSGRDGLHDHRHGLRDRGGADQVDGALRRRPWASTSSTTGSTPSACTTISPSMLTPTGRCRSSCAGRRAARPSRATSSTCTRACSSAPASSRTSWAAAR